MSEQIFVGVDVGASRTKVVIWEPAKEILGFSVKKSGTNFTRTADLALEEALSMADVERDQICKAVSTGYGRNNVTYSDLAKTEIGCHAKGCYYYFPREMTIVDIGGQDNKIIKLDSQGRRISFKMNRKCAAGTGAFLEEMSMRMDIPLEEMDSLAREAVHTVELGSFCTVFTATEVLAKIREGEELPALVRGLFLSVLKRVMEMESFSDTVVMTGGVVAHNTYLVEMLREQIDAEVLVPPYPQLTGAVGAALYAMDL